MTDAVRPDQIIRPDGRPVQRMAVVKEGLLALPNLIRLLGRLLRDPRVPRRSKGLVVATIGYLIIPIDPIPDFIPILGQTDDLLLIAFALHHLIRSAGEEVVLDHWDGSRNLLEIVNGIVDLAAGLVPRRIRRLLEGVLRVG